VLLHLFLHLPHRYLLASSLKLLSDLLFHLFSVQLFNGLLSDGSHNVVEVLLCLLVRHLVQQNLTVYFDSR